MTKKRIIINNDHCDPCELFSTTRHMYKYHFICTCWVCGKILEYRDFMYPVNNIIPTKTKTYMAPDQIRYSEIEPEYLDV